MGRVPGGRSRIALNFGHRRSDDFDWFGPRAVPPAELLKDVRTLGRSIEVDQNNEGTFLAAMKLLAIAQRAVKRDYVDIHALLTIGGISLEAMVYAFHKKFPTGDPSTVVRALTFVGDVDKGPMPEMLNGTTWHQVKKDLARALERFDLTRALSGRHKTRGRGR
jgi:hypothetical protein